MQHLIRVFHNEETIVIFCQTLLAYRSNSGLLRRFSWQKWIQNKK